MSGTDAEEGFRVSDRRHRPDPPAGPSPPGMTSPSGPRADGSPSPSLVDLFLSLAHSATLALGQPPPGPAAGEVNLPEAAALIDLLRLLREKTEAHRTEEETRILSGLIYDLQLRYVQATRRSG